MRVDVQCARVCVPAPRCCSAGHDEGTPCHWRWHESQGREPSATGGGTRRERKGYPRTKACATFDRAESEAGPLALRQPRAVVSQATLNMASNFGPSYWTDKALQQSLTPCKNGLWADCRAWSAGVVRVITGSCAGDGSRTRGRAHRVLKTCSPRAARTDLVLDHVFEKLFDSKRECRWSSWAGGDARTELGPDSPDNYAIGRALRRSFTSSASQSARERNTRYCVWENGLCALHTFCLDWMATRPGEAQGSSISFSRMLGTCIKHRN